MEAGQPIRVCFYKRIRNMRAAKYPALAKAFVVICFLFPAVLQAAFSRPAYGGQGPETSAAAADSAKPLMYSCRVVKTFPHDPQAFTQGLIVQGGVLYESTGLYGASTLRKVDLETGKPIAVHQLPPTLFGEGLTEWKGTLVQLTWKAGVALLYDRKTLKKYGEFSYTGQGWGLTNDGHHLIMSDGSSFLRFLDPITFAETRRLEVRDRGVPVKNLNELEFVKGEIYANVWMTPSIARISPRDGTVLGWIDCTDLYRIAGRRQGEAVLNGIAYDADRDRLFVTGKFWPRLFEIEVTPASPLKKQGPYR